MWTFQQLSQKISQISVKFTFKQIYKPVSFHAQSQSTCKRTRLPVQDSCKLNPKNSKKLNKLNNQINKMWMYINALRSVE